MSYRTGTAQTLPDFFAALNSFAQNHGGWNSRLDIARGHLSIYTTDLCASASWFPDDDYDDNTFSLHHATDFTQNAGPGEHPGDSGIGVAASTVSPGTPAPNPLLAGRCVARPGDGPFNYWLFAEGDTQSPTEAYYIHAVLKGANDQYSHFGFGRLDKLGTYTGGEYVYGHMQEEGPGEAALSTSHSILLDGLYGQEAHAATVRTSGLLAGEVTGSSFTLMMQDTTITSTDSQSVGLEQGSGGFRGGIFASPFGSEYRLADDLFQPLYPITAIHRAPNYAHGPTATVLGTMDGVAGVDITLIDAEAIRRVGEERWIFFPAAKKTTDNVDGRTDNIGIAYRIN